MTNRLAAESSPYLLQHANNPVDWYPWGAEAFARAEAENKPVLLSIGYAACHWCHVMAHESFEDAETAALMNDTFVNIKVDREERPDVDGIYMQAVQAMIGHGGWPMTVALTPKGEPFWGGTYFPPLDRQGMPSFKRVLRTLSDAWLTRRDSVDRTAQAMRELYANAAQSGVPSGPLAPALLERAFAVLARQHDPVLGGFGTSPKFPQAMSLDFCLRWSSRSGNPLGRDIAHHSFVAMMRGGMYDQVGGGFHRYSVDAEWLVPHFEKMLYDNALLARLGVSLWQVTRDDEIARCVEQIFTWVAREMTSPAGGFYASLDADSEGHEGTFYVWSVAELDNILGDDARTARAVWNVSEAGNFEGRNILHVPKALADVATALGTNESDVRTTMARASAALYRVRSAREWPGRDEKILAGWNGLMTRALAEAARVFDRADWLDAALRNGEFLRREMVRDGRVMRVHTNGVTKVSGFLEDHAAVALAFLALYEATFLPRWLQAAREVAAGMRAHFRDAATGLWYDTADDGESLITRPREQTDNAVPAGTSLALELTMRLAELEGETARVVEVAAHLEMQAEQMAKWPNGFGHVLGVVDMALFGAVAVAVVGAHGATSALARAVASRYLPTLVLAGGDFSAAEPARADVPTTSLDLKRHEMRVEIPALLRDRPAVGGQVTAYVCRGFVCEAPTTDASELSLQLATVASPAASRAET